MRAVRLLGLAAFLVLSSAQCLGDLVTEPEAPEYRFEVDGAQVTARIDFAMAVGDSVAVPDALAEIRLLANGAPIDARLAVSLVGSSSAIRIDTIAGRPTLIAHERGVGVIRVKPVSVALTVDTIKAEFSVQTLVHDVDIGQVAPLRSLGSSAQLAVVPKSRSGVSLSLASLSAGSYTWVSRSAGVATVNAAGVATAVSNGSTWIVASLASGPRDSTLVTVAQLVDSVALAPDSPTLSSIGATVQLTPTARDSLGVVVAALTTADYAWVSRTGGVVTVSASGVVTAVANGTAVIVATAPSGAADSTLATVAQVVDSVALAPDSPTLSSIGATVQLTPTALDSLGVAMPTLTATDYTWVSRTGGVATVSRSGTVTAIANGTAMIVATASTGVADSTLVTVGQVADSVALAPDTPTLTAIGATQQLTPTARDALGVVVAALTTADYAWVSRTGGVVTVSASGVVTAVANGTAVIVATAPSGAADSTLVTVAQVVDSVALAPDSPSLSSIGATVQLTPTALDSLGVAMPTLTATDYTWVSRTGGVATVSRSGTVTAVTNGTAMIVATASNGVADSTLVTVGQVADLVALAPDTPTLNSIGATQQLTPTARDASGVILAAMTATDYTWVSRTGGVATVSASGVVTAVANGTAVIVATAPSGAADSTLVTVAQVVDSVALAPDSPSLSSIGATVQLTPTALDSLGVVLSSLTTADYTWVSRADGVATVSASGLVTAVTNGTAMIVATASNGVADSTLVTVAQVVDSVALAPDTPTLTAIGATQQLTATARDALGVVVAALTATDYTWVSRTGGVATVSTTGMVTAVANGTAVLVATAPNGVADSTLVTVGQIVDSVAVTPTGLALTVGSSAALAAAAFDVNNTSIQGASFTWASLNPAIAMVDGAGTVTPVSSGQVVISATAGGVTAYALVTMSNPSATPVNLWVEMTAGTSASFQGVWGTSPTNVFAVGQGGTIRRFNGSNWSAISSPTVSDLTKIWGTSPTNIFAVGEGGAIVRFDGTSWSSMASGTTEVLWAVWGSSPTDVFAVGANGTILHFDGVSWSSMTSGTTLGVYAVWGTSPTNVFAAGVGGMIRRFNGTAWTAMTSGTTARFDELRGTSPTNVYAIGNTGNIRLFDGTSWLPVASATTQPLRAMWAESESQLYVVGDSNTVSQYNGTGWTTHTAKSAINMRSLWGTSTGDLFAVGTAATIRRGVRGASVELTPDAPILIGEGSTRQLTPTARDAVNAEIVGLSTSSYTWVSRDEAVATVSASGMVTAVSVGTSRIVATVSGGAADSTDVTVQPAAWWSASLDFAANTIPAGWDARGTIANNRLETTSGDVGPTVVSLGAAPAGILGFVAEFEGSSNPSSPGHGQAIRFWTGTTENRVGIQTNNSSQREVFAVAPGQSPATVQANAENSAADQRLRFVVRPDSVFITVWDRTTGAMLSRINLAAPSWDLSAIDSVSLRASVSSGSLSWMNNVSIRAITSASEAATLDVANAPQTLVTGESLALQLTARRINGTVIGGAMPTWTSLDPGIATVASNGVVTAVAVGTATIRAELNGSIIRAVISVVTPSDLVYQDAFTTNLSNWTPYDGTWGIVNGVLQGDYNIGCGTPSCSQALLILNDGFQPPPGNWRVEIQAVPDTSYCCYNGGAVGVTARLSLFVSASEKEAFHVGHHWGETQTFPASSDTAYVGHSAWVVGTGWNNVATPARRVPRWNPSERQFVVLEKTGNTYRVYFNGAILYTVTRTFSSVPKIGFHTYGRFKADDFRLFTRP